MITISAVIITLNEEKNISRCIDSLKNVAEDILVVDSFSTDKTEEICKQKGVRFIQHVWEGYLEQKNYANSQALYPYILSIDADEALSEELARSINNLKNNWQHDGYGMNRLTNYCGKWIKHGGWYPDRKIRLFDRRKASWGGYKVHEKLIFPAASTMGFLKGDLLHYSYYTRQDHIAQADKFSTLSSEVLYDKGVHPNYFKRHVSPLIKFIRNYFLKCGFLDGYYGFVIAKISAEATYLKYKKLKQLYLNKK